MWIETTQLQLCSYPVQKHQSFDLWSCLLTSWFSGCFEVLMCLDHVYIIKPNWIPLIFSSTFFFWLNEVQYRTKMAAVTKVWQTIALLNVIMVASGKCYCHARPNIELHDQSTFISMCLCLVCMLWGCWAIQVCVHFHRSVGEGSQIWRHCQLQQLSRGGQFHCNRAEGWSISQVNLIAFNIMTSTFLRLNKFV